MYLYFRCSQKGPHLIYVDRQGEEGGLPNVYTTTLAYVVNYGRRVEVKNLQNHVYVVCVSPQTQKNLKLCWLKFIENNDDRFEFCCEGKTLSLFYKVRTEKLKNGKMAKND